MIECDAYPVYKTKKALKESKGEPLHAEPVWTIVGTPTLPKDGVVLVTGPSAHTKRNWFAQVTLRDGLIHKVT